VSEYGHNLKPITMAQAWSAPIVICVAGVGFAIWGFMARRESYDVTAAIVIMIVAPATATSLIARGLVGIYQRHLWQGCAAIFCGVALIAVVVFGLGAVPWRGDSQAQW
jgi:hypothetical protein